MPGCHAVGAWHGGGVVPRPSNASGFLFPTPYPTGVDSLPLALAQDHGRPPDRVPCLGLGTSLQACCMALASKIWFQVLHF